MTSASKLFGAPQKLFPRVQMLVKSGLMKKPLWYDTVQKYPPITPRPKKTVPKLEFAEDKLLKMFYSRNKEARNIPINFVTDAANTPASIFVTRQVEVMKTHNLSIPESYEFVKQEFDQKAQDASGAHSDLVEDSAIDPDDPRLEVNVNKKVEEITPMPQREPDSYITYRLPKDREPRDTDVKPGSVDELRRIADLTEEDEKKIMILYDQMKKGLLMDKIDEYTAEEFEMQTIENEADEFWVKEFPKLSPEEQAKVLEEMEREEESVYEAVGEDLWLQFSQEQYVGRDNHSNKRGYNNHNNHNNHNNPRRG